MKFFILFSFFCIALKISIIEREKGKKDIAGISFCQKRHLVVRASDVSGWPNSLDQLGLISHSERMCPFICLC